MFHYNNVIGDLIKLQERKISRTQKTYKIVYIFLLLVVVNSRFIDAEHINGENIVGIVEETEIKHKKIPIDQIIFLFKLVRGDEPETEAEKLEVEKERKNKEKELIVENIRSIIYDKQVARFGIKVTKKELVERLNVVTEGFDFDAEAKEIREIVLPLLTALKLVYEEGEDKDEVYNKLLTDKITKHDWEVHHNYYRTPEMRKVLERGLTVTADDFKKPNKATRAMVESQKLDEAIDKEIAKKDPEFAEYKTLSENDPKNKKLQQFNPNYLDIKRGLWWQEQYKKAKIEIKDDRFRDVLRMLIPTAEEKRNSQ